MLLHQSIATQLEMCQMIIHYDWILEVSQTPTH